MRYGVMLSNVPDHYTSGLSKLAQYKAVELQLEMWQSETNSKGERFTPTGEPPAIWLKKQGVSHLWAYIDARWPLTIEALGDSSYPPESNQYWFRRQQAKAVKANDWWLYGYRYDDPQKKRCVVEGSYQRPATDTARRGYSQWLLDNIPGPETLPLLRFDDEWVHRVGMYRPFKAEKTDDTMNAESWWLFDQLRQRGHLVIANGAWEPNDPDVTPFVYGAINHVGGCMIELPKTGFARWSDGKWWALNDTSLERIVADWRTAGKYVILVAKYTDGCGFDSLADMDAHYTALASEYGCWLCIQDGTGPINAGSNPLWLDGWKTTWYNPAPEPRQPDVTPPSDVSALVAELSTQVAALTAQVAEIRQVLTLHSGYLDTLNEHTTALDATTGATSSQLEGLLRTLRGV